MRISTIFNSYFNIATYLNAGAARVPVWPADTESVTDSGTLEECGCPCPRRDNGGGDETGLHGSARGAEHFRGLYLVVEAFEDMRQSHLL